MTGGVLPVGKINNMKRKTAKEILAESFREIAGIKPINRITVKDITDNCGYSPATFYRHFKDKYDLIAYDYVTRTEEIISRIGTGGYGWRDALYDGMRYFEENKTYIRNLLLNTSGIDAFPRNLAITSTAQLTDCILRSSGMKEIPSDLEIYIRIYVYGTVQMLCYWLTGELRCTSVHLAELFENALPEPLRKYMK